MGTIETTYTALRENLASYLDRITDDREVLVVKRRAIPRRGNYPRRRVSRPGSRLRTCFVRPRTLSGCLSRLRSLRRTTKRQF